MGSDRKALPWYRRVRRWGQTNITEIDPLRYDVGWWREHWRRTRVQGVIVNAGGIVAYYPSRFPLHHRPVQLGDRDLFGEVAQAARQEGLAVLARMDSNRLGPQAYRQCPEWFARDREGRPFAAGEQFVTCVNGEYYRQYLPQILREIIERARPDGFADNSWSGLGREAICYCQNCARKFRQAVGCELPARPDWSDPAYRHWIRWSYACRLEVWDLNNRLTRQAGGEDCWWVGMVSAEPVSQSRALRDLRALAERSPILLCDHQGRSPTGGFEQNALNGKLLHGLLGWDKLIPESMAMYVRGIGPYRIASAPAAEARTWMIEGFAGGLSPWWHHIGAWHEDRRQYQTAEPLMRWHEANEAYLYDRQPVATVGVVWSQQNIDFFGRDQGESRVAEPFRGMTLALTRARIPYVPVHADQIEQHAAGLSLLVLPNVGALSDSQCDSLRRFVAAGGGLLATGQSSLYDEWGDRRGDFALAALFAAHSLPAHPAPPESPPAGQDDHARHTYLRLLPSQFQDPSHPHDPATHGPLQGRHEVLAGLEETDIIPFGGRLELVQAGEQARVPMTYIPAFVIFPPELSWMRTAKTDLPGLVLHEPPGGGRVAYLAADLDRCLAREQLPDHSRLIGNLVRWAAGGNVPLEIQGPGFLDCHLYRQPGRLILHLVNLTHCRAWPSPGEEPISVGPFGVRVRLPEDCRPTQAALRVSNRQAPINRHGPWAAFRIDSILDHELVVIE